MSQIKFINKKPNLPIGDKVEPKTEKENINYSEIYKADKKNDYHRDELIHDMYRSYGMIDKLTSNELINWLNARLEFSLAVIFPEEIKNIENEQEKEQQENEFIEYVNTNYRRNIDMLAFYMFLHPDVKIGNITLDRDGLHFKIL